MSERTRLIGLLALLVGLGCAGLPGAALRKDDGRVHAYARAGDTGPVVVFESGLGDGKEVWRDVFEPVSRFARVLAYDRAGYGRSRSPVATRDGAIVVAELRALLDGLELPPPYVLVGHSLGGQFVEHFARAHPEEVAGVVFVDARAVDFSTRCLEESVERCGVPAFVRWLMPEGARAELDAAPQTERGLRTAGPFPPVPVRVLSATRRPASMPRLRRVWAETQTGLVELSPAARQDVCETCGHYVQRDAPERVVAAIREVVEQANGSSAAAPTVEATPPPTEPERLAGALDRVLPSLETFRLDNGLRVVLAPRRAESSVSVRVAYDVGARDERPGRGGVAHLFEHLMFKGSAHVPDGGHFRIVRDVGGRVNATTDYDTTQYWNTVPSGALERVLFAEADRMLGLRIDDAALDNQRAAIREEGLGLANLPYVDAATAFGLDLWRGTPYGHSPLGTEAELAATTLAKAKAFHAAWYAPDNAVLVVAGGFEPGAARRAIEGAFGAIPRGPDRPARAPVTLDRRPRATVARDPLAPFPVHAFVWQTVGATHPDAPALAVLDDLLMGHADAALVRTIARPLALDGYALPLSFRDVGLFNYVFVPRTFVRFEEIRRVVRSEIERLRQAGPTMDATRRSVRRVTAARLAALQTSEGLAAELARGALIAGDPKAFVAELEALDGLDPEALRAVARRWLTTEPHTLVIQPTGALRWIKAVLEWLPDGVGAALEEAIL